LRWIRGHLLELAIVVLTPPFLPASVQTLRAVRALRLLRLLRLPRLLGRVFSVEGLRYAAVLALLTMLGSGAAFSELEKNRSTWDGVWWAATTMTTVGYGDVYPATAGGRVLALVVWSSGSASSPS
jgi:voltage-gated potassium channel